MKNSFSNALLCGVIATSFLLINCQKAPSRGVQAGVNPAAKQTDAPAVVIDCNTDMIAAINARDAAKVDMQKVMSSPLDADQSVRLQKDMDTLKAQTDIIVKLISAQKVKDVPANACSQKDPKDATKILSTTTLAQIQAENTNLLTTARKLLGLPASGDPSTPASGEPSTPASGEPSTPASGEPSTPASPDPSIPAASQDPSVPASPDPSIGGDPVDDQTPVAPIARSISDGQTLSISAVLGEALDKSKVEGEVYMARGELLVGKVNFQQALLKADSSMCMTAVSAGPLTSNDKLKVMEIKAVEGKDSDAGRNIVGVQLLSGDKAYSLSCVMPKDKNVNTELASILGDLVKVDAAAAPAAAVAGK